MASSNRAWIHYQYPGPGFRQQRLRDVDELRGAGLLDRDAVATVREFDAHLSSGSGGFEYKFDSIPSMQS